MRSVRVAQACRAYPSRVPADTILAIEISNPSAATDGASATGVALARGGALLGGPFQLLAVEPLAADKGQDDDLLPAIDRICKNASVQPTDLGLIGVSIGPGGFTALRMAIAAAKMISDVTGARCIGVPSAHVVAQRIISASPFAVALASKGNDAFVSCFEPRTGGMACPRGEGRLMSASDLAALNIGLLVADRYLPQPMRDAAIAAGITLAEPVFDPAACAELAAANTRAIDPMELLPIYPREPEAVVKWRALKQSRAQQ
jgi:tRNA threonylcarbamoyladenosine biosynthesis protein TsaB